MPGRSFRRSLRATHIPIRISPSISRITGDRRAGRRAGSWCGRRDLNPQAFWAPAPKAVSVHIAGCSVSGDSSTHRNGCSRVTLGHSRVVFANVIVSGPKGIPFEFCRSRQQNTQQKKRDCRRRRDPHDDSTSMTLRVLETRNPLRSAHHLFMVSVPESAELWKCGRSL